MKNNKFISFLKKHLFPIALIIVVFASFSYSSFAFVISRTEAIENQFKLQTTDIKIVEEFKNGDTVKKNVSVQNTGEATMYVRVALVEQLTYKSGSIIPNSSDKSYFTYENLTGADWFIGSDGYYYYSKALKENEFTSMLFTKAEPNYKIKGNEKLSLNILAEAIQVNGIEKWDNVTKNADGTLGGTK